MARRTLPQVTRRAGARRRRSLPVSAQVVRAAALGSIVALAVWLLFGTPPG